MIKRTVSQVFRGIVEGFGTAKAKAPAGFNDRHYVDCWDNDWLAKRLYGQWKYVHAVATGKQPAKSWFLPWDDNQDPKDWKHTAMRVMNAEYAGNATYEWFDFKEDENGEKQMYRVNQFDRIKDTSDPRLHNPALDYLFAHPEMTVVKALKEFKKTLSEKMN